MAGKTANSITVEVTIPPIIGLAMGFMTSAPAPWLHKIGRRGPSCAFDSDQSRLDKEGNAQSLAARSCCNLSPGHHSEYSWMCRLNVNRSSLVDNAGWPAMMTAAVMAFGRTRLTAP